MNKTILVRKQVNDTGLPHVFENLHPDLGYWNNRRIMYSTQNKMRNSSFANAAPRVREKNNSRRAFTPRREREKSRARQREEAFSTNQHTPRSG